MSGLLVVEDEPTLARALGRLFTQHFEQVHVVSSATEAAALHARHRQGIDVVFTDVHLPDGDGITLLAALRNDDPTLGAVAAEYRDMETSSHLERMSAYAAILARRVGLDPERCEQIRLASPMHDIGKLGIPDDVLLHDGPFSAEQRQIMSSHTLLGHEILAGSESPLLDLAATIALTHHEWWDGTGYPNGLSGTRIPIEGRIVAIADVSDALCSPRRYKRASTVDETIEHMRGERGTHFDPELLDVFLDDVDELLFIRAAHPDRAQASPAPVPALSAWNLR